MCIQLLWLRHQASTSAATVCFPTLHWSTSQAWWLTVPLTFIQHNNNNTHLTALCPGLPGWAGTRKVKPIWISLKQETVSGSGVSWAICKSAPRHRQITTPVPDHSVFFRPDALPVAQTTASKHWRPFNVHVKQNNISQTDQLCDQLLQMDQHDALQKRLNLALAFLRLFCVVAHFFWLLNECFCCVRFSFFHTKPRDWLGETSPKWPILCRVGRKTTTNQSINQPHHRQWMPRWLTTTNYTHYYYIESSE